VLSLNTFWCAREEDEQKVYKAGEPWVVPKGSADFVTLVGWSFL
jgi:hypothetical protein